jgi:hypothetical protein
MPPRFELIIINARTAKDPGTNPDYSMSGRRIKAHE